MNPIPSSHEFRHIMRHFRERVELRNPTKPAPEAWGSDVRSGQVDLAADRAIVALVSAVCGFAILVGIWGWIHGHPVAGALAVAVGAGVATSVAVAVFRS